MRKITVHMIGQAHLDPVWLWRWTEGRAEALATSQSAVDRLHEYPDFHFTRGEAQVYQWIEWENPELFRQILALIHQGRWHVVNGMVVQPDMNLPQGESFVRQILLGKIYMREHLGVEPHIAYCVDSFGHAGTLPQILKKCGFDAYVFMRPGPHEKELPANVFWWQAPDGNRVLAFRIIPSYATRPQDHSEHISEAIEATPPQLSHTMCFFGVGNHGGGPTKQQIENIQAIARSRDDVEIRFSSPEAYFAAIAPEAEALPVVAEELQFHAVGCYSVVSELKRAHRQAECSLLVAERMAALAELWADRPAPRERLRALWHDLCFNQFHDTLGGTCIKEATDEAIMAFGRVILGAREIADDAGRAIAARVNTAGPGGTVVLFNPFAEPITPYVEYEPWTDRRPWEAEGWGLVDEKGHPVPYQLIETHEALSTPRRGIKRLVFQAKLPPLGYRVYRFMPNAPRAAIDEEDVWATTTTLENDRLILRLDPDTGNIISCVDKDSGLELVGPDGWNVPQVLKDTSDTWSHGVRRFDQVIGTFGNARITVCDNGPLQASILVERHHEENVWLQQIILRRGEAEILVRNWLTWQGHWTMLKLAFDVPTDAPQAAHDIPFGWCCRPCDGSEVPTQMWMDVSGPARDQPDQVIGLAVLDDGKYGCDVRGSVMRLTILRSPPYAYHIPHPIGTKHRYDWIDQGQQEFTLVLRPHVGDWRDAGVVHRARELNLPLVPITMHCHEGELPPVASLMEITSPEMELTALKPAEDGDGYIVRVVDRHGRGGKGELRWREERFPLSLAPFEVVTLRLAHRESRWQAIPCDMIEQPLKGLSQVREPIIDVPDKP
ncbi:MAG: alpha-mannosidase [Chloroflexi bacterium]|nr:alpha-mannosidase [Chloroflexota bacterium]